MKILIFTFLALGPFSKILNCMNIYYTQKILKCCLLFVGHIPRIFVKPLNFKRQNFANRNFIRGRYFRKRLKYHRIIFYCFYHLHTYETYLYFTFIIPKSLYVVEFDVIPNFNLLWFPTRLRTHIPHSSLALFIIVVCSRFFHCECFFVHDCIRLRLYLKLCLYKLYAFNYASSNKYCTSVVQQTSFVFTFKNSKFNKL